MQPFNCGILDQERAFDEFRAGLLKAVYVEGFGSCFDRLSTNGVFSDFWRATAGLSPGAISKGKILKGGPAQVRLVKVLGY